MNILSQPRKNTQELQAASVDPQQLEQQALCQEGTSWDGWQDTVGNLKWTLDIMIWSGISFKNPEISGNKNFDEGISFTQEF